MKRGCDSTSLEQLHMLVIQVFRVIRYLLPCRSVEKPRVVVMVIEVVAAEDDKEVIHFDHGMVHSRRGLRRTGGRNLLRTAARHMWVTNVSKIILSVNGTLGT